MWKFGRPRHTVEVINSQTLGLSVYVGAGGEVRVSRQIRIHAFDRHEHRSVGAAGGLGERYRVDLLHPLGADVRRRSSGDFVRVECPDAARTARISEIYHREAHARRENRYAAVDRQRTFFSQRKRTTIWLIKL